MSDDDSTRPQRDPSRDKRQKINDKYKEINERVNNATLEEREEFKDQPPSDFIISLLYFIEKASDGLIFVPINIRRLKEWGELQGMLREAWKSRSYGGILELDYLQSPSSSSRRQEHPQLSSGSSQLASSSKNLHPNDQSEEVLRRAWNEPFRGDCVKVLLDNINGMYSDIPYRNICAIVQSSGTGKSRMVNELAKQVYTLPINIRRREGIIITFPPPDDLLHEYLVTNAPNDEVRCKAHYESFFQRLFTCSAQKLTAPGPSSQALIDINKWYKLMDDPETRDDFYKEVLDSSVSAIPAKDALEALISKLKGRTKRKVKMVIYIDEAHELKVTCTGGRTKLDLLCSVVSDFSGSPLFCLLLSTQSSLHFLAPTRRAATSERAKASTGLPAPITETPFDCSPKFPIEPSDLHIEDLSTLDYLAMWGRPLWWTMLRHGSKALITLARIKLLSRHDIHESYGNMSDHALIAVLDVLLAFDFEPNREPTEDIQANLVKSHMRIAYSVPQHRLYFRSGYPSEPLLAEAAAQQLWAFHKREGTTRINSLTLMLDILTRTRLLNSTIIDVGQRGEVFMRVCLMRAYMDAVLQDLEYVESEGVIFSRGCRLSTFIEQLFEPQHATTILAAEPDNLMDSTTFFTAFEHSMVRFTHFVKAGDEFQFTSEALSAAFTRGMAFIGYQTQQAVDFAIPVLLNKGDTLQESAMSAILIQVKRRVKGRSPQVYAFSQEDVGLFPRYAEAGGSGGKVEGQRGKGKQRIPWKIKLPFMMGKQGGDKGKGKQQPQDVEMQDVEVQDTEMQDTEVQGGKMNDMAHERDPQRRPYIAFVAELGIEPEEGKVKGIETPSVHVSEQPSVQHHPHDTHPRYAIIAYGCTGVYRHVTTERRALLLATRDFFAEHPRKNESLDLVMRLKPIWRCGKNFYHWLAKSELLKQ